MSDTKPEPCPTCGRCPTCGHSSEKLNPLTELQKFADEMAKNTPLQTQHEYPWQVDPDYWKYPRQRNVWWHS